MSEEEMKALEEIERCIDYDAMISVKSISILYTLYMREKEKNKKLEENLKIATAMLTKGTYPEQNEGDNDFCKQFIPKSKVKELSKKYEFALNGYDSSTADYIHSQNVGRYMACVELLKEGE